MTVPPRHVARPHGGGFSLPKPPVARFLNLSGVVELMILIWYAILSLRFGVFYGV